MVRGDVERFDEERNISTLAAFERRERKRSCHNS